MSEKKKITKKTLSKTKSDKDNDKKGKKEGKKSSSNKEQLKKLPSREEAFTDWLNEVIFRTEIIDYRYNLKGCGVWRAYGFQLRKNIFNIVRNLLESTEIPHEEYLFPLLVPEDQFMKEAEHVKGFEDEVYWVTHGGLKELDVKLALRPTSETVMYPMFALWIRSHSDLPLKTYQLVNTFRYEGKNTRPLIRVREITTFKEAHTCHESAEDAQRQILEALDIYSKFFEELGLSFIVNKRPKWDTFPGAEYTIAYDVIFPGTNRTLQIGTVHNLGQTFAKTFNIVFETKDKKTDYVYQTCYGISERAIASVIALHGDDKGLVLPPNIAPIQVVIIPILFKKTNAEVIAECERIYKLLKDNGIRTELDKKNIKPGPKFYFWEQKGVPLRVEIGPRDLESKKIVIARRDTGDKKSISSDDNNKLIEIIRSELDSIYNNLKKRAAEETKKHIFRTEDLDEAIQIIEENKGVVEIPFCGSEECASEIEKRAEGLKFLGIPARYLGFIDYSQKDLNVGELNAEMPPKKEIFCLNCSKKVEHYWTIGRSY
ncbi:MAG: proline--tRNA ligase [Promethearchaeota archaeon]